MKYLDPQKTRFLHDRVLCEQLLFAVAFGHIRLTWGSRNRRPICLGAHGAEEYLVELTGPLVRGITRSVATLADLDDQSPRHGQFGLIIEAQTAIVDVEITGPAIDMVVALNLRESADVLVAARRVLKQTLDLPPPYVELEADDQESSAVGVTKRRLHWNLRIICNIFQSLIILTAGLPVLSIALLVQKFHWFGLHQDGPNRAARCS
jgi:hypothetical protein